MKLMSNFVIALLLICILASPIFASGGTLTYWYSDGNQIGRWSTPQLMVYLDKLNTSAYFTFYYSFTSAGIEWEDALGITIDFSKSQSNANAAIKYYGGTRDELMAMGITLANIEELGYTRFWKNKAESWTYKSTTKKVYNLTSATGYIIRDDSNSSNNYMNAATHELGHALGWFGHSTSTYDIMYPRCSELYKLSNRDKNHLSQVY